MSKLTEGRNCAGGGGLLILLPCGAFALRVVLATVVRRTEGGFALLEREPDADLDGTNCTLGRLADSLVPSMLFVGLRHAGTKDGAAGPSRGALGIERVGRVLLLSAG